MFSCDMQCLPLTDQSVLQQGATSRKTTVLREVD